MFSINKTPINFSILRKKAITKQTVVRLIKKYGEPTLFIAAAGIIILLLTVNPFNRFNGLYHTANWQFYNENADGTVDVSNEPFSIRLTGGNNHSDQRGVTDYTIVAQETGVLSFNWRYTTSDAPMWDPFGIVINGKFIEIVSDGRKIQSGRYSLEISKGDVFGFRILSNDNFVGSATVVISNFSAPKEFPFKFVKTNNIE